jgi:hypothetical protein
LLFNLGFFERDVLPDDGIVLIQFELRGLGTRILFCHVKEAGIGRGHELDLNGIRFGHQPVP